MRRSPRAPDAATDTSSQPSAPTKRTHTYPRWRTPATQTTNRKTPMPAQRSRQGQETKRNDGCQSCARLRPKDCIRATEERGKVAGCRAQSSAQTTPRTGAKAHLTAHKKHGHPTLTAPPKRPQAPTDAKGPPRDEKAPRPRKEPQNKRKQTVVGCKPMSGGELRAQKIPINPVDFR
jgi:hypothetical protein